MQPISQLSKSNEVATFIDDDQFGFGQSVDKCGYEAVSLFWHSVAPGKVNPYHASDIHAMASVDYRKFAGPDIPANHNGMSLSQLYADLSSHRFGYRPLSLSFDIIDGWVACGYPVILAVTEDSVYDEQLKAKPYNWNTTGYSHIILCTGKGLFRDTANVEYPGVARPGPRQYDTGKLQLLSATAVFPSWLPIPKQGENPPMQVAPTPPPPVPPDPVDLSFEATPNERALWELGSKNAIFNPLWAICHSWILHFRAGHWYGVPLESEQSAEHDGVSFREQAFSGGYARWNSKTGEVSWSVA